MGVIKRKKKKAKNGYVYEVNFTYKVNGISQRYWKSGLETKKEALDHEAIKKAELQEYGNITKNCKKTLNEVYKEFCMRERTVPPRVSGAVVSSVPYMPRSFGSSGWTTSYFSRALYFSSIARAARARAFSGASSMPSCETSANT